jgi:[pyruvate, water dikinase]-phosphate phosphotransferase / [pyruvate, water dikinase] kinase
MDVIPPQQPASPPAPAPSSTVPSGPVHLHLVSDSTGETVYRVARACLVQFEGVEVVEHVWSLVRSRGHLDKVLAGVASDPGAVMFTLVDDKLRRALIEGCRRINAPCIPVLDSVIAALGGVLGMQSGHKPGRQHTLDAEYFARIDAMTFALAHDDGQSLWSLDDADIVLVGVSRTSKTPTCMYLANRGVKAANIPLVPGVIEPPPELLAATRPLIVGLTNDPDRLLQVRRNRLRQMEHDADTSYTDIDDIRTEVMAARRFITDQGWPVIDVTRRSIEETAAAVLQLYRQKTGGQILDGDA